MPSRPGNQEHREAATLPQQLIAAMFPSTVKRAPRNAFSHVSKTHPLRTCLHGPPARTFSLAHLRFFDNLNRLCKTTDSEWGTVPGRLTRRRGRASLAARAGPVDKLGDNRGAGVSWRSGRSYLHSCGTVANQSAPRTAQSCAVCGSGLTPAALACPPAHAPQLGSVPRSRRADLGTAVDLWGDGVAGKLIYSGRRRRAGVQDWVAVGCSSVDAAGQTI